jgi:GTP pyrophosphokinase
MPQAKRMRIHWAYDLAKRGHSGQLRDTGERYFEHVRGVANILIDHGYVKADDIILGILHDILEDTTMMLSMLERLFGPEVAREIVSVSKTYGIEDPLTGFVIPSPALSKEQYFGKVLRNGKRADRIFNLRDLVKAHPPGSRWTPEKRLKQAEETREWVIPLAEIADSRFVVVLTKLCDEIESDVRKTQTNA